MENLTKSKERVEKYGEVFTPQHIVEDMCDMLEKENPSAFLPERTFLEPTCGEGAFVLEILRRKFKNCKKRKDYTVSLESVYGFELLADNVENTISNIKELCREFFKPNKEELEIINNHIIQCDSLKVMKLLEIYGENKPTVMNVIDSNNLYAL